MAGIAHDDVVENFDFEKLARSNELASDPDVRFGQRGVAAWMVMLCASPIYVHQEGRKFGGGPNLISVRIKISPRV